MRADEHHQWELEQQERLEKDRAFRERMTGTRPSRNLDEAIHKLETTLQRKRKHAIHSTSETKQL